MVALLDLTPNDPFVVGEKPVPILHTFQDANGQPLDISGYQVRFSYREHWTDPAAALVRNGAVQDGPAGKATYAWDGTELSTPGTWYGELWAGNGVARIASTKFRYTVRAPVGAVPAI